MAVTDELTVSVLEPGHTDECLALAAQAHAEAPHYASFPFCAERARSFLEAHFEHPATGWVVQIDGAIVAVMMAYLTQTFFGQALMAEESILYVVPERREQRIGGLLVELFTRWAQRHGAAYALIGVSAGINEAGAVAMLEQHQYQKAGQFMRRVFT